MALLLLIIGLIICVSLIIIVGVLVLILCIKRKGKRCFSSEGQPAQGPTRRQEENLQIQLTSSKCTIELENQEQQIVEYEQSPANKRAKFPENQ